MPVRGSPGYTMGEFFVDDVMSHPFTMPCVASGAIGIRGIQSTAQMLAAQVGSKIAAHHLTL